MGDPIKYKGEYVGYVYGINHGRPNDGFVVRFDGLDRLVRILSLPNTEKISIGRDSDTTTIGEFKEKFIGQNGLRIYCSSEMERRDAGEAPTHLGTNELIAQIRDQTRDIIRKEELRTPTQRIQDFIIAYFKWRAYGGRD